MTGPSTSTLCRGQTGISTSCGPWKFSCQAQGALKLSRITTWCVEKWACGMSIVRFRMIWIMGRLQYWYALRILIYDVYMTCIFSQAGRESPASVQSAETALDSMARICVEFRSQCHVGIQLSDLSILQWQRHCITQDHEWWNENPSLGWVPSFCQICRYCRLAANAVVAVQIAFHRLMPC